MCFQDKFTVYTMWGDAYTNTFEVKKEKQTKTEEQWKTEVERMRHKLMSIGIFCPKENTNVLVTCNRVQGIEFDQQQNVFYKTY